MIVYLIAALGNIDHHYVLLNERDNGQPHGPGYELDINIKQS